jgi:hypothetical protein
MVAMSHLAVGHTWLQVRRTDANKSAGYCAVVCMQKVLVLTYCCAGVQPCFTKCQCPPSPTHPMLYLFLLMLAAPNVIPNASNETHMSRYLLCHA